MNTFRLFGIATLSVTALACSAPTSDVASSDGDGAAQRDGSTEASSPGGSGEPGAAKNAATPADPAKPRDAWMAGVWDWSAWKGPDLHSDFYSLAADGTGFGSFRPFAPGSRTDSDMT